MKVIEQEIHSLKNSISEMWALVHQQLYNAGEAMLTGDPARLYNHFTWMYVQDIITGIMGEDDDVLLDYATSKSEEDDDE